MKAAELVFQVNEVERESNIFGGCSPMQSGRVLYQKNMRVTAKQLSDNRNKKVRFYQNRKRSDSFYRFVVLFLYEKIKNTKKKR